MVSLWLSTALIWLLSASSACDRKVMMQMFWVSLSCSGCFHDIQWLQDTVTESCEQGKQNTKKHIENYIRMLTVAGNKGPMMVMTKGINEVTNNQSSNVKYITATG